MYTSNEDAVDHLSTNGELRFDPSGTQGSWDIDFSHLGINPACGRSGHFELVNTTEGAELIVLHPVVADDDVQLYFPEGLSMLGEHSGSWEYATDAGVEKSGVILLKE